MIGRTISHYTVLEKLGSGGMGEIYKAQDVRLNRFVAMKVMSASNSGDAERRRRFVQEAQAASALNHPNIITIHDVVSTDGMELMVMEFVSGATLVDLIPREGLSVRKTLEIGVQIASALESAHAAGIVHRDLKPANVMVTASGLVKILDFGIAKLIGPTPGPSGNTDETLPIDSPMTVEGSILGTVSYMSPEQAQARAVDPRSDIFSFGLVLYEMLTGQKAFAGETAISTLTAILRDDVKPMGQIAAGVPPEFEKIVDRALRKDPVERWQSTQEMRAAMLALMQAGESGSLPIPMSAPAGQAAARQKSPLPLILAAAAALLILAGAGAWWWIAYRHPAPAPVAAVTAPPATAPPEAAAPAPAPVTPAPPADQTMTDQSVIDMVQAKVPDSTIVNQIRASQTNFDLSTKGVIELTQAGVSSAIIESMRNPKAPVQAPPTATPVATPAVAPPVATAAPPPAPKSAPGAASTVHTFSLTGGTQIVIALAQDVPAKLTAGQAIPFTVVQDVVVGDTVVLAKGTPLNGEVVDAGDGRKLLVVKNKATFRLNTVDAAGGNRLTIRATPPRSEKTDRPIETGANKSKDVAAVAGWQYIAYLDGDQTVTIRR